MAKCRLLFPPSFLSLSLPRPVSTSCRPRKVGKYFLLALFPDPTTATADFHVPPERREREGERLVLRRRRFCRFAEWSFGEGRFC